MIGKPSREIFTVPNTSLSEAFIQQLPDTFSRSGEIIHNARNQIRVFDVNGQKINVKKFCIPPIVNRILYSWGWRIPKAKKTFLNAQEILKRGFQTPEPYGYIIERNGWLINFSYFISRQVENMRPIRDAGHDHALIEALAVYTAQLHKKGLWHKDYTPGNILYRVENGEYSFLLVDINRFRFFNAPLSKKLVVRNLMQPFHEDELLKEFVREYAQITGWQGDLEKQVLAKRHFRNFYDEAKRNLKKIPGVKFFLGKNLK